MSEKILTLLILLVTGIFLLVLGLKQDKETNPYYESKRIGAIATGICFILYALILLVG